MFEFRLGEINYTSWRNTMRTISRIVGFFAAWTVGLAVADAARADDERVVTEAVVEASVDDVWRAWTTKQGIESWMVAQAEIELKVGGKMLTHYDPNGRIGDPNTIENTILSFEPKRMLSIKATKDRKSTRLNSSHIQKSRMPSSA